MIGLGRMGANIARRLMRGSHEVIAFDRNEAPIAELAADGAIAATSLEDAASKFDGQRIFWVILPAGAPTETTVETLTKLAARRHHHRRRQQLL